MPMYLIESPHTQEECKQALKNALAMGYLTHFQWGCKAGEHKGFIIFEAGNQEEALMVVPSILRHKARALELTQFTVEQVKAMDVGV